MNIASDNEQARLAFKICKVTSFVDLNAQIHNASLGGLNAFDKMKLALEYIGNKLSRVLASIDQSTKFDVTLRMYHGWHKGFEPTENRKAFIKIASEQDFEALSVKKNVQFRSEISYGDLLILAKDGRFHRELNRVHLPNTLRIRADHDNKEKFVEKMVDTAIAADVVHLAHCEPERWLVVMAEDDDLIPPIYTADAIRGEYGGRVVLIRKREPGRFLKLDGILCNDDAN